MAPSLWEEIAGLKERAGQPQSYALPKPLSNSSFPAFPIKNTSSLHHRISIKHSDMKFLPSYEIPHFQTHETK
jgi:hypothetical protein